MNLVNVCVHLLSLEYRTHSSDYYYLRNFQLDALVGEKKRLLIRPDPDEEDRYDEDVFFRMEMGMY